MRILSLIPSATEILYALGLEEEMVGVGRYSNFPPEVAILPVLAGPRHAGSPPPISDDQLEMGAIDYAGVAAAEPDVIFVGPWTDETKLRDGIADLTPQPQIVCLDPASVEGIFHAVSTVGSMTEMEDDAVDLLEELREGIAAIEQQVLVRQDQGMRPKRAVVLQSLEPLLASGLWVPELVRRSGGWDLLAREGESPAETSWEEIRAVDPEMLLLAPVGKTLLQAQRQWRTLERPPFWPELDAVRRGQVFFLEPVYLNRPGPRIVDGMGMLAEIFDSDAFVNTSPPDSWTPLFEG